MPATGALLPHTIGCVEPLRSAHHAHPHTFLEVSSFNTSFLRGRIDARLPYVGLSGPD